MYKIYRIIKLWKLQNIQSLNCGNYTTYKINISLFLKLFEILYFSKNVCILECLVYFVQWSVILNIGFGFCVFSVYEKHQPFKTKIPRYENCSHFWENVWFWEVEQFRFLGSNIFEKYLQSMFPYTDIYTESESDIQNINLLYKIHQTCQNTFEYLEHFKKIKTFKIVFYYLYKLHSSYFVFFGISVIFVIL